MFFKDFQNIKNLFQKFLNIVMIKIRMFSCVYNLLSIKYQATIHELKTHAAMGYVIESICNR